MQTDRFTAKKTGRPDYMGHSWFAIFNNGEKVMKRGVHVKVKTDSAERAVKIHIQFP